jgi:hypothetical protein
MVSECATDRATTMDRAGHEPGVRAAAPNGFALPMALLVISFLAVGVATSFTRVENEVRINRDRDASLDAFRIAQSGLEHFAVNRGALGFTSMPPAPYESTRIALPGGHADVVMRRIRPKTATQQALYALQARGSALQGATASTPPARHVVSQLAFFREGTMQVLSAWTVLTGLTKNGGAGTISGEDACGAMPPVAGVALPTEPFPAGTYVQNGGAPVPDGSPPILGLGTQAQASNAITIDWNAIVNHGAIQPDIKIPGQPWPSFADPNFWPVVFVNSANFSLPSNGRGTLIVTGDLTISGSLQWRGIILVGGSLTANGNNNIRGAVVSGLNVKLGQWVAASDVGNGTKTYQYDSCAVAAAAARFAAVVLIRNTWSDSWATY